LLPLLAGRPELQRLQKALAPGEGAPVLTGVAEAAKPYVVATLALSLKRPLLYVLDSQDSAERSVEALKGLVGNDASVLLYPDRDALPYERLIPDSRTVQQRMNVLTAFAQPEPKPVIAVCSARALAQPVMPPDVFADALLELRSGLALDPRHLLQRLMEMGYEMAVEVEDPGQVSHRGGIVDVFAPALERPVRIEFWGDEIDSIRTFDPETQRSLNPVETVVVGPAREALAAYGPDAAAELSRLSIVGLHEEARERWGRDLEALRARQSFDDIVLYLPYLHTPASLLVAVLGCHPCAYERPGTAAFRRSHRGRSARP
jgi:transcription-repair coupling factor (superfamily II helicase)